MEGNHVDVVLCDPRSRRYKRLRVNRWQRPTAQYVNSAFGGGVPADCHRQCPRLNGAADDPVRPLHQRGQNHLTCLQSNLRHHPDTFGLAAPQNGKPILSRQGSVQSIDGQPDSCLVRIILKSFLELSRLHEGPPLQGLHHSPTGHHILGRDGPTADVLNDFGCQIDWAGAAAGRVRLHVRGCTVAGREWVRAESNAARGSNRRQLDVSFVPCLEHLVQFIVASTPHEGTKNLSVQNTKEF